MTKRKRSKTARKPTHVLKSHCACKNNQCRKNYCLCRQNDRHCDPTQCGCSEKCQNRTTDLQPQAARLLPMFLEEEKEQITSPLTIQCPRNPVSKQLQSYLQKPLVALAKSTNTARDDPQLKTLLLRVQVRGMQPNVMLPANQQAIHMSLEELRFPAEWRHIRDREYAIYVSVEIKRRIKDYLKDAAAPLELKITWQEHQTNIYLMSREHQKLWNQRQEPRTKPKVWSDPQTQDFFDVLVHVWNNTPVAVDLPPLQPYKPTTGFVSLAMSID